MKYEDGVTRESYGPAGNGLGRPEVPEFPEYAGPHFRRDIKNFVGALRYVLAGIERSVVEAPHPDFVSRGNFQASPPDASLMMQAVEAMGHRMDSIAGATDTAGQTLPHHIETFVDPDDGQAVNMLMRPENGTVAGAYSKLLHQITSERLSYYHLAPGHSARSDLLYDLRGLSDSPVDIDVLVKRGFLTAQLYKGVEPGALVESRIPDVDTRNLTLYETLRGTGVSPLDFENLSGLAYTAVHSQCEVNPAITPPGGQDTETDNIDWV
jgi:hypothetical protein